MELFLFLFCGVCFTVFTSLTLFVHTVILLLPSCISESSGYHLKKNKLELRQHQNINNKSRGKKESVPDD